MIFRRIPVDPDLRTLIWRRDRAAEARDDGEDMDTHCTGRLRSCECRRCEAERDRLEDEP